MVSNHLSGSSDIFALELACPGDVSHGVSLSVLVGQQPPQWVFLELTCPGDIHVFS